MTIDERTRHRLFLRLEQVLGPEEATVLMEHLPPVGWGDVATKADLAHLEARIDLRFAAVDARFDAIQVHFDASLERSMRRQSRWFMASQVALVLAVILRLG